MVLRGTAPIATNPLRLEELPAPPAGAGEIRLRVSACGVCRTDLHVVEGDLPEVPVPIIPGHQVIGRIDTVGAGVSDLKEGDRVGIAWLQGTCDRCEFCAEGRENLCAQPRLTGYQVHGGYAEHCVAPARWAYRIPQSLGDEEATPLLCAGIIGYRALRLSSVGRGQRLGIYGFGNSAHLTIQVARHWGCEVFVCSHRERHRALARDLGAAWVGATEEMPPAALHGAILFAPAGEIVPMALRALRPGGTLACAGIHMTRIPGIDYDSELFRERVLRSVTANTRQDGLDFLREAAAIPIRTRTRAYRLEEANRALRDLKAGRVTGAAVLRIA